MLVEDNLRSQTSTETNEEINHKQTILKEAFTNASADLPEHKPSPHKPWISQTTLDLLDRRLTIRYGHDYDYNNEAVLTKQIKASVKKDKTQWLEKLASTGSWDDIKFLRNKKKLKQGRLRDSNGHIVDITAKADTFAKHLQDLQWRCDQIAYKDGTRPSMKSCPSIADLSGYLRYG